MATKPRLLLLDANAVIAALEAEAWNALAAAYEILLPSTVVHAELIHYFDRHSRRRIAIDAAAWVSAGTVTEIEMQPAAIRAVLSRFREPFVSQLDAGEAEAIAYLLTLDDDVELWFVTSDAWAIQAAVMLDLGSRMQCLAEALEKCRERRGFVVRYFWRKDP